MPADLRDDAHFVGFVPSEERSSYYASGDVLLCPAVGGTFGIIALEAMAAGCPVVAADTPGFRNVITDGVEGYLVDVTQEGNGTRLAARATQLLADPALRARCVELGRAKAACFDWPAVTTRILAIYEELLRTPHASVSPAA